MTTRNKFKYGLGHNNSSNKIGQIKNLITIFWMHIFKISQRSLIDTNLNYKMTLRLSWSVM